MKDKYISSNSIDDINNRCLAQLSDNNLLQCR